MGVTWRRMKRDRGGDSEQAMRSTLKTTGSEGGEKAGDACYGPGAPRH